MPEQLFSRSGKAVIAFTVAYIAVALAMAFVRRSPEFIYYISIMVVLCLAIFAVHRHTRLSDGVLWAFSIWGLSHMAGGLMPVPESWPTCEGPKVLYNLWLVEPYFKYDQLVHAYGFGVTTWACWQGICAAFRNRGHPEPAPSFGLLTICVAAGMGFGALNEIVEFVATLMLEETNVGGYVNTGWDLVANLAGGLVAAFAIRAFSVRERDPGDPG